MRNFQNSGTGSRPQGGSKPPSGRSEGSYNREHRGGENRGGEHRSGPSRPGEHRGGNRGPNRFEGGRNENRGGEHRSSGPSHRPSSSHAPSGNRGDNRYERGNRFERSDRYERKDRFNRSDARGDRPEGSYRPVSSWVEVSARSVEEALEEASRRFNVTRADLKTEVLDEGTKGFLGIGSKPARVKVALKPAALIPFAEGVLTRLLRGMGLPDSVKSQKDSDNNSVLNIEGPSSGALIGRHGHTLEALQYLVLKVVQRVTGDEKTNVVVDVENYLERQKDKLKELAVGLADKAKETGVEIPMRPMSSKDRRVVHMTLKDHEHVTTESRGEGLRRKVVIVPKVKAVPQAAPEAAPAAEGAPEASATVEAPVEPGNIAPPEPVISETVSEDKPEPGNMVPKEKDIDDNVGNRA